MYVLIILDNPHASVSLFLNQPEGEEDGIDPDDKINIGDYHFETVGNAQQFYEKVKNMSAIDLMIFHSQIKDC